MHTKLTLRKIIVSFEDIASWKMLSETISVRPGEKSVQHELKTITEFEEGEERNIFYYFKDYFLLRGIGINSSLS